VTDRSLTVEFVGERWRLDPPATLTFGRVADVVVDDANFYLHRLVGRFFWRGDLWWLENLGGFIELEVVADGGPRSRLPLRARQGPPMMVPLTTSSLRVVFTAGGARYELGCTVGDDALPLGPAGDGKGGDTEAYGDIDLTDEEHALLVRLARPFLCDPTLGPDFLPTNRAAAAELGWSITTFNRKLDYLCKRLTDSGVRGLQGSRGAEARSRRWRLVEHAINARLVTRADVECSDDQP
jgi:hypothetical protein